MIQRSVPTLLRRTVVWKAALLGTLACGLALALCLALPGPARAVVDPPDTISLFRPDAPSPNNTFFLRNANTLAPPANTIGGFGNTGDVAVVGDWNGDGIVTIGVFRPNTPVGSNTFFLRNTNNLGTGDITIGTIGQIGDIPIVGDWDGNGTTTIGLFRPNVPPGLNTLFLWNSNTDPPGPPDITIAGIGAAGDLPIVGRWTGAAASSIGLLRPNDPAGLNTLFIWNSLPLTAPYVPDLTIAGIGAAGDLPLAGDWNGNATATIGLFRSGEPSGLNTFFLWNTNPLTPPYTPDIIVAGFGAAGVDRPVTGHWGNNPPAVDPATFTVLDGSPNGTVVGTVTFTDPDNPGQNHTFSIQSRNTGGAFTIDGASGQITVANSAAVDLSTNPTFSLTVRVTDDGTPIFFGEATITVNVTPKQNQTISFTSSAPGAPTVGGPTYNVTATGGASGNPVTFTIDASASTVCSISGGSTVSFIGVGTCVIDANQAGNATYNPAPQVQQSFAVGQGSQTISFTSVAPAAATVGGPTYNVTATATSGLAVAFTIDPSATTKCSIVGSTVSFTAVGTCVINANQAGNANYTAAPQVQQSFAVGQGAQAITFTSTAPTDAVVGGPTYTVTANGGASGNAVTFTIDAPASTVCSISAGSTVSFGPNGGTCVINANQAGSANYNPAPQAQQSFQVKQAPAITSLNSYTKQIGTALSFTVTTTGTPAPTVSQAAAGGQTGFPGGVTFTPSPGSAAIGGSVTSGGAQTYTTTITANNGVAPNATQAFSLIITCPTITVTRTGGGAFPAGTFNVAYTGQSVTASGGTGPYTFVVATGALPTNLSLASAGGITGTPSATGTFLFTVTATDSTGCTGTSAQFSIAITPVAGGDTYNSLVNNTEAVVINGTTASPSTPFVPLTGFVTANDTPAGVTITSSNPIVTTQGGSVTIAADGSFKYTPPVTVTALASDSFTYTISSNTGGTATPTTANGTVTLNLAGRVWYVNPNLGSNGNGQSQSPWNSTANIKQQPTVGGANTGDTIFVYNGPTGNLTANIPLLASQTLHGEGLALVVNSVTLRSAGTAPSLTASSANVVSVNNGNTIKGVTLTNSTNALISGAPAGLTLNTVTMTPSGSAHGFDITGGSGTVALTDVTMTGTSSGDVVKVNTGTQSWTFTNSPITQTSGRALNVANKTGGGMTFDATSTVTVSAGTTDGAILLSTNSGAGNTFGFSKIALTTTGIARALALSSTGTVNNSNTTSTLSTTDTSTVCGAGNCGAAVDATSTALGLTFATVNVTGTNSHVAKALNLSSVTGTLTMNGGSISINSGRVADIDTGTASVTYAGTISNTNTGTGIRVANKTGGTVTFSGATKTLNTGANTAVTLSSNTGATINFTNGGLDIDTTTVTGFNATGGATAVNVTGTGNTITSTTGTALNVVSTTIGASGLTFQSISANGAATGINLDSTGASGGLTVTGNSAGNCGGVVVDKNTTPTAPDTADCTGGTIQNAATGIRLNSTSNVSLTRMRITGTSSDNFGIYGTLVTGFTLSHSVIHGSIGNTTGGQDAPLVLGKSDPSGINGLAGTSSVTDSTISGGIEHNFEVYQLSGSFTLNITRTVIQSNSAATGSDGFLIETQGTSSGTVVIDNSHFNDNRSQASQANSIDSSTLDITVKNSWLRRVTQGNEGLVYQTSENADMTVHFTSNRFTGILGAHMMVGHVALNANTASNLVANISGNTSTVGASGGPYPSNRTIIAFPSSSTGGQVSTANILIDNNTINTFSDPANGLAEPLFVGTPDPGSSPSFTATVTNNTVNITDPGGTALRGIQVAVTIAGPTGCFDVRNNDVNYLSGAPGGVNGLRVGWPGQTVQLEQGASAGAAAVVLAANNPLSTTEVLGTVTVVGNSTCQNPPP